MAATIAASVRARLTALASKIEADRIFDAEVRAHYPDRHNFRTCAKIFRLQNTLVLPGNSPIEAERIFWATRYRRVRASIQCARDGCLIPKSLLRCFGGDLAFQDILGTQGTVSIPKLMPMQDRPH